MSKYTPLRKCLQAGGRDTIRLTFEEIKVLLGFDIYIDAEKQQEGNA